MQMYKMIIFSKISHETFEKLSEQCSSLSVAKGSCISYSKVSLKWSLHACKYCSSCPDHGDGFPSTTCEYTILLVTFLLHLLIILHHGMFCMELYFYCAAWREGLLENVFHSLLPLLSLHCKALLTPSFCDCLKYFRLFAMRNIHSNLVIMSQDITKQIKFPLKSSSTNTHFKPRFDDVNLDSEWI